MGGREEEDDRQDDDDADLAGALEMLPIPCQLSPCLLTFSVDYLRILPLQSFL